MLLLLAACGDSGNAPGDGSTTMMPDAPNGQLTAAQACVQKTNFYRTTVPPPGTGSPRPALTESSALDTYATTGAMYDASHTPHAHFMATNGGGIAFAENECPASLGWTLMGDVNTTVQDCVTAFYNGGPGEGHYENMMSTSYTKVGCGVFVQGQQITITQDFGN